MKLLFVLSEYLPDSGGGIISYYAGVLPYLVKQGHEVQVLVAARDSLDRNEDEVDGVRITYLKSSVLDAQMGGFERFKISHPAFHAFLPIAWAAFEQAAAGKGFDVVETTDFPLLFAPWVAGKPEAPVNISLHGSPGQLDWFDHPGAASLDTDLLRLVERAAFTAAGSVQANSASNAAFWQRLTRREVPVLLPSYRPAAPSPVSRIAAKEDHGLVVGRLQRWKGPHVLCEALGKLPEVTVRWIGKGVDDPVTGRPIAEGLAMTFPKIFGSRLIHQPPVPNDQVRKEIANADFLCVPSTWDVFNLTAVEAMELGTPVICSIEAGASMLIEHRRNGFLFDPRQPRQLVEAIRELRALTTEARCQLVGAAQRTVEERLNPELLAKERVNYYERLMRPRLDTPEDSWLAAALSPRCESRHPTELLGGFTTKELLAGAARQIASGTRRRIGGLK